MPRRHKYSKDFKASKASRSKSKTKRKDATKDWTQVLLRDLKRKR